MSADPPALSLAMNLDSLRPILCAFAVELAAAFEQDRRLLAPDQRLAYSEEAAADLLGLKTHQLRDERLRGRITHTKIVGGSIRYEPADLLKYLRRHRVEADAGAEAA